MKPTRERSSGQKERMKIKANTLLHRDEFFMVRVFAEDQRITLSPADEVYMARDKDFREMYRFFQEKGVHLSSSRELIS